MADVQCIFKHHPRQNVASMPSAMTAPTEFIEAANGARFAYRRIGKPVPGTVPLVMHIHFRANMDFWDPLFLDALATNREVIIFDNTGVGKSTGEVPVTYTEWAEGMIAFILALGYLKVDILGFSMGGLAVTLVALNAPSIVRKLVIAGSRASIPSAMFVSGVVWPQEQPPPEPIAQFISAITYEETGEALRVSMFPISKLGDKAFNEYWARVSGRAAEPLNLKFLPMEKGGDNQMASILDAFKPNPKASFDRLGELDIPVLVANGDNDVLVPSSASWELLTQIENAQLIIYPKSGHGFIWQYAERFAEDIQKFLDGDEFEVKGE